MRNLATNLRAHSTAWYERLAKQQEGYYYPWQSTIAAGGGEAAYTELVRQHLSTERDVLEVGCGHGRDIIAFAPLCRTMRAYDQVDRYASLARQAAGAHGIDNVTIRCHNSSADHNHGQVKVPAPAAAIDVVISRRGPTNWIEDVRRCCRPGAVLLQLHPLAPVTQYEWQGELPEGLGPGLPEDDPDTGMHQRVQARLAKVYLAIHEYWIYDVAEGLHGPRELYRLLTFGNAPEEVPSWPQSEAALTQIFERHAAAGRLELRNRRLLWKAVLAS
jgi:SAM-dependent methyltransferase